MTQRTRAFLVLGVLPLAVMMLVYGVLVVEYSYRTRVTDEVAAEPEPVVVGRWVGDNRQSAIAYRQQMLVSELARWSDGSYTYTDSRGRYYVSQGGR